MNDKKSLSDKEMYSYNPITKKKEYCYRSEDVKEVIQEVIKGKSRVLNEEIYWIITNKFEKLIGEKLLK